MEILWNWNSWWLSKDNLIGNFQSKIILVFSWPSWVGKDSIVSKLIKNWLLMVRAVSFTTRDKRPREIYWKDYYFFKKQLFQQLEADWEVFEYTKLGEEPNEKYYGYTNVEIDKVFNTWRVPAFIVDPYWLSQIKEKLWEHHKIVSFFILPPNLQELQKRLETRGWMSIDEIKSRVKQWQQWIEKDSPLYDYRVVNDNLQWAVDLVTWIYNQLLYWNK